MSVLSQNRRLIQIDTPAGKDAFIVSELIGDEYISDLFRYTLELFSDNHDINQKDLVGKDVTISIFSDKNAATRYIHGYINHIAMLDVTDEGLRRYRIEVTSGLWFTTLGSKNRVFHKKNAKDIITEVLGDYASVLKTQFKASGPFTVREYCVQFDESDFEFVSRLMAEEGISYYFTHGDGKHEMVMADDTQDFFDAESAKIEYDGGGSQPAENTIHSWQRNYNYHTGGFEFKDYSEYTTTKDNKQQVKTKSPLNNVSSFMASGYGIYHFEADGETKHKLVDGQSKADVERAVEAQESGFDVAQGTSNVITLTAGGRFQIDHSLSSETGKYLLTHVHIIARDGNGSDTHFSNRFSCVPSDVIVRPQHTAFRRKVLAPQIATIDEVKATASESSDDPYTQVKVIFPWNTKQNSCWVRVVQQFAGKGWGANFVPRVGQEVVINYINGDPDRPLVTGAVYNGTNEGPNFTSTQSGWKTAIKDSKFNELRFDDKSGEEEIYMEAGKDHNWLVHNDQTGNVENDQTLTVENNRTETITSGNDTLTVKTGNKSTEVSSGNHSLKVSKGTSTTDVMGAIKITSKTSIELKVGANSIKIDQSGIQIKGTMVKAKASAMGEVSAGGILTVKGALTKIN
ncbi:MAG: type VI secretion system tip protein VgrG [Oceanospirillaceae bacterium]|nr:type VI secretion system tip protein VgrG [Oceanospirillaceae bacterium]MBT12915.1 type VI secretion system tip protein VgrG [Oceanospirillaceae bacterium]|tara:strand:- start:157699 stop:159585 length:1887 start_codon:yes stop_codon:yes gene_type:complete